MPIFYRVDRDITENKELRAQSIAAFMLAQSLERPEGIQSDVQMNSGFLQFVVRDRAIRYWSDNGWITLDGDSVILTGFGLEKIHRSLNGDERGYSVTEDQVISAANIVRNGSLDEACNSQDFDL